MGCCSSQKKMAHSKSPTKDEEQIGSNNNDISSQKSSNKVVQNTERVNPQKLQQHHNNQADIQQLIRTNSISNEDDIPISGSFANNESIMKEVMRLEQFDIESDKDNNTHITDVRSNEHEHSNDSKQESLYFDKDDHIDDDIDDDDINDHPFGITMQNQQKLQNEQYGERNHDFKDLEAFYAENLKQSGFDADKFRNANLFKNDSMIDDDRLSSQSEDLNNEYDDLMYKELSRATSMYEEKDNDIPEPSIQESVQKGHGRQLSNIMDDEDEELMDAILSLDIEA